MKELVIISGKGGTGKTTITAAFAALAKNKILADCDVDAPDLHLVLAPEIKRREDFSGGRAARVIPESCIACGECMEVCRFDAVVPPSEDDPDGAFFIEPVACEGCGVCAHFCEADAIAFEPEVNGEWFISDTRHGPMVHAHLGVAQENSGKLVSLVRAQARRMAEEQGLDLIICDGSPGIGCPVISSITGADMVLIVSEPTVSGAHDLERVAELAKHFMIPAAVCVNKHDINPDMADKIETYSRKLGLAVAGRVPYDVSATAAQVQGLSVVEHDDGPAAQAVRQAWRNVLEILNAKQ